MGKRENKATWSNHDIKRGRNWAGTFEINTKIVLEKKNMKLYTCNMTP